VADWVFVPRTEARFLELLRTALGVTENQWSARRDATGVSVQVTVRKD
jgi:hypothetical protein